MRVFYRILTPLIALAATACGATPTNDQTIPETQEPTPVVSAAPTTPGAPGMPGDRTLVTKAQAAFQMMQGYQAELNYMQKMGAKTSKGIYDIAGRKPRKLRIHIKQGTGEGAKLLWEGGRKLKVRAGGLLGAIALELPLDDGRFISVRNYTLDQTDIHSIFAIMTDPSSQIAALGPDTVAVTGPKVLKGCQRMVVRFDAATSLPTLVEANDAKEVVFRMQLKNFRRNDRVSLDI
ncbi:MAG: hypothetical protein ACK46X_14615 [Candidatus Sericytochromatia bacterium]